MRTSWASRETYSGVLRLAASAAKPTNLSPVEGPLLQFVRDQLDRVPYVVMRDDFSGVAPDAFEPTNVRKADRHSISIFNVAHQGRLIGMRHEPNGIAWGTPKLYRC